VDVKAFDQQLIIRQEVVSMRIRTGLLFTLAVVSLAYPVTRQAGAQIVVQDIPPVPVTISFSESPDPNPAKVTNRGTLTWNGQNYDAKFDGVISAFAKDKKGTETTATITFARDQQNGVTLNRTDTTGTVGVTATYTGRITADNKISGTVTWSFGTAPPYASGKWSGTVTMPAAAAQKPAQSTAVPLATVQPLPHEIPIPDMETLQNPLLPSRRPQARPSATRSRLRPHRRLQHRPGATSLR
jgi:hypothetical protein